jgi:hypothetical protein
VVVIFAPGVRSRCVGQMRREAGIEREAARRAEHRASACAGEAAAIGRRQRAGAAATCLDWPAGSGSSAASSSASSRASVVGRLAEQAERARADPLRLAAEPGEVEIGLENLVLAPAALERPGGAHLAQLVEPAARARGAEIGER